jgi:hypothetical protein
MKKFYAPSGTGKFISLMLMALLVLITSGCKKQNNITFNSFPNEQELKGEKLNLVIYTSAVHLELMDTLLFIRNSYDDNLFISIYHKNTFQHIKSFCKRGKGPEEMVYVGYWSIDKDNGILWVPDFQKVNIWGYNVDSLLKFPGYKPTTIISLPKKLHPMMGLASFNSELFAVPDPLGEVQLFFFDRKGEQVSVMEKMDIKDIDDSFYSDLTRTHNRIHSEKQKMIMVYRYFDRMILYDLKTNQHTEVIGPDHIDEKKQLAAYDHERLKGYTGKPKFDDRYIYLFYNGGPAKHVDFEKGKVSAAYGKKIHIFDWNGNPVMRLILDHEISDFVVDKENKRIIAFAVDAEDNLISYDISHIPELN